MMKRYASCIFSATLVGAFLGLGAPLGYLLYSFVLLNPEHMGLLGWSAYALKHQTLWMVYLTVPTVTVFSLFGFWHGVQEARLASRKDQMARFLHIAAHDIRAPLGVIYALMALIKEGEVLGPFDAHRERLTRIAYEQIGVINELLDELLNMQKIEAGQYRLDLQPLSILPLVRKSVDEMAVLIEKKSAQVEVIADVPEDTQMQADAFKLRQVLRNLLSNAIRHSAEGGKISVRVSRQDSGDIEITVSNEGPRIPEEYLAVIFDRLGQAGAGSEKLGAGLGLAICKEIVALHKGEIRIENTEPSGVRAWVRLPANPGM